MKLKKRKARGTSIPESRSRPKKCTTSSVQKPTKKLTQRQLMEQQIEFYEKNDPKNPNLVQLKSKLQASKKGSRSKNKGASYERSIAAKFKERYNIDLTRTPMSGGFAKKSDKADDFRGDITCIDKDKEFLLHCECKDHKTWSLPKWIQQATSDCPKDKEPLVIFHKFGTSQSFVCMDLESFFRLVDTEKIVREK